MCQFTNESQMHPLEMRVQVLERYLEEAINIVSSKIRPEDCSLGSWVDEAEDVLHGN